MSYFFIRSAWFVSAVATGFSYFAEYMLMMEACPMCLDQRYLMMAVAIFLFPAWSSHPFFKILGAIAATAGLLISYEHTVLYETPYDTLPLLAQQLPYSYDALAPFMTLPVASLLSFGFILFALIANALLEPQTR